MANYSFNQDLTDGEKGESVVRRDLESTGAEFLNDNKDFKYDLSMIMPNGKEMKLEIKTDVLITPEKDTLNMFVEFESRGKKSGISVTEADFFVTYFANLREIWYISTNELIEIISENNFRKTQFSGDAGSNTKGFLIPRYQFKKHFKVRLVKEKW
jgi:hypothetical protein